MTTTCLNSFAVAAALLVIVPSMAMAQVTGTVTHGIAGTCYMTTFEGGGQFTQVAPGSNGLVPNTPIRFPLSDHWVTLLAGPYRNNPSGTTIGLWASGNATANVTFEEPVLLESLIFDMAEINLAQGINNSVDAKLDAAFAAIIDASENNDVATCNALDALVHFVEVECDHGKLTDDQAVFLINAVVRSWHCCVLHDGHRQRKMNDSDRGDVQ